MNSELQLYYYDAQRSGSSAWVDRWVQAHQVLNNWDELQADSLKRLTGVNWLAPRAKIGPGSNPTNEDANGQFESTMLFQQNQTNTWKVWNLTALTQKWLNGTTANYGVILWATNEDVNAYDLRFYSRENATNKPKLVVTWSNTPKTVYFLKDHLGSVRATVDQSGTVVGYEDYDPWGYALAGRTQATQWTTLQAVGKNKFTGKEWDDEYGVNWGHFPFRSYDPEIGRWMVRDPLAEKFPAWSPYVYAYNNSLSYIDLDGRQNYLKQAIGIFNILRGVNRATYGVVQIAVAAGASPVAAVEPTPIGEVGVGSILSQGTFDLVRGALLINRGMNQAREAQQESTSDASLVNLLGLLPFGGLYDDPGELERLQDELKNIIATLKEGSGTINLEETFITVKKGVITGIYTLNKDGSRNIYYQQDESENDEDESQSGKNK